jgi:branched-chain amino acid transport system substrate-binding protein
MSPAGIGLVEVRLRLRNENSGVWGPTGAAALLPVLLATSLAGSPGPPERESREPHVDARRTPNLYHGPGREEPEPTGLTEVILGYFGPGDPDHPEGGDLWLAAQMAEEEVNAAGGYQGLPFRLQPVWAENPWGTGVARVARRIYSDPPVWLFLTALDGPSAHLVAQVVAKARLPMVNSGATDRTANLANVPSVFGCFPGEPGQVEALVDHFAGGLEDGEFVLVSATDYDSRVFLDQLRRALGRRGLAPAFHFTVDRMTEAELEFFNHEAFRSARAVLLIAGPVESTLLLVRLRRVFHGPVYGTPAMARRVFIDSAPAAGELIFPFPADPAGVEAFSARFAARYGRPADYAAAQTYDSIFLVAEAIRRAGLNRARIGDALRELSPW